MMKKLFAALVGLILCNNVWAQKEPGTVTLYPRIGMNLSKFSGDKIFTNENSSFGSKHKSGMVFGAELQYQISQPLAVSGGVMYSQQGTSFDLSDYKEEHIDDFLDMRVNYINVPLMLVATTKYGLSAKVGVQPEFRVSDKWDHMLTKVNFSIPVGLAYEYHNVALDVRYNIGITSVYKAPSDKIRNSTFTFTLGYGINL